MNTHRHWTIQVSLSVYWLYVKSLGVALANAMLVFFLLAQLASILSNLWLSEWTSDPLMLNATLSSTAPFAKRQNLYLGVYGALSGTQGTTAILYCHTDAGY